MQLMMRVPDEMGGVDFAVAGQGRALRPLKFPTTVTACRYCRTGF